MSSNCELVRAFLFWVFGKFHCGMRLSVWFVTDAVAGDTAGLTKISNAIHMLFSPDLKWLQAVCLMPGRSHVVRLPAHCDHMYQRTGSAPLLIWCAYIQVKGVLIPVQPQDYGERSSMGQKKHCEEALFPRIPSNSKIRMNWKKCIFSLSLPDIKNVF